MLMQRDNAMLLVIDVQTRLVPVIHDNEAIVERCAWLLDVAQDMAIPSLVTEQYPAGLGPTVESLRTRLQPHAIFPKHHFSCLGEPGFSQRLHNMGRQHIVVAGMEAHVCVMQSVLQLCEAGWSVFVTLDALGSRDPQDKSIAVKRMEKAGATLVTSEMLFFEWLRRVDTPEATELLRRYMTGSR